MTDKDAVLENLLVMVIIVMVYKNIPGQSIIPMKVGGKRGFCRSGSFGIIILKKLLVNEELVGSNHRSFEFKICL